MNLVQDPWLPFKLQDGSEQTLPISAIVREDVVDFALPRADFQGAAYQFAIGLLQTVLAPKNALQWHDYYENPAGETILQTALDTAAHAFNCLGDGPLFMQDFDEIEKAKSTTVAGLLIEAPGGNGLKLNTDHFIKRGIGDVMSLEMANLALFTLQVNAPSGGQGHRTGLRGGGPLTTLILPQSEDANLWQKLWLNVISREFWQYDEPDLSSELIFPWLAPTKTSEKKGSELYTSDVHPLQMYWAMPRRIRLEVENQNDTCALSGTTAEYTVRHYRTQNYGVNYSGAWQHPLTPYKWNPKKPDEETLSAKGQPGGIHYKTWDVLTLTSKSEGQACALVVSHFYEICRDFTDVQSEVPRLWAFGYDMDNMKARGWYATSLPLFSLIPEDQEETLFKVKALLKLASDSLWHGRSQIKAAWFEKPTDVKGDMTFIDQAFWQKTEAAFFTAVNHIVNNVKNGEFPLAPQQAETWLRALQRNVIDIFDDYALSDLGTERSMAKRIKARQRLTGWLYGGKDIKNFIKDYNINTQRETA